MEKTGGDIIEILTTFSVISLSIYFLLLTYLLFVNFKKFFNKNRSVYTVKGIKIKRPSLSAIFSFVIPGLGQINNGEIFRGLTYLIICIIISSIIFFPFVILEDKHVIVTGLFAIIFVPLLLFVYIDGIRDAYRTTLVTNKKLKQAREKSKNTNIEDVSDMLKKGIALYKSGNYQAAIDAFSDAINFYPNYGTAYYNRGVVYYKLSNYVEAGNDFIVAAELGHKKAQNALKSEGITY